LSFGPVVRWGVENAAGWGRHTAIYLGGTGHDVRDVCPNRTGRQDRGRQRGKSDTLDAERIARETLGHPLLPHAFKRAQAAQAGPDEHAELLGLRHKQRRSLLKSRQHLLNEAEFLLAELPLELRERLPDSKAVRPRLAALACRNRRARSDAPTALRLRMLDDHRAQIARLDAAERDSTQQLRLLVAATDTTLDELCGLSTRSVAELLVEIGDPRRFTEGGFARFNGSAPLAASTAEGPGEPVRHRFNPGGNRRVNAILHRMAVTQLRCEPRAQTIYANARARGHTKREARRILKRHLSDVIHRRMMRDLTGCAPGANMPRPAAQRSRPVKRGPTGPSAASRAAAPLTGRRAQLPDCST
jgi:transposase